MPIEMPKGLPFSVDTWTPSSKRKKHHFLTHAHKDHCQGISAHFSYPIYSTHITKNLTIQHYPQIDDSLFVGIEVGQTLAIDDPDGSFSVTAFDANHCPGAVMFLFEGNFGNILHTRDCRLNPECLQCLPGKYIGKKGKEPRCRFDYVFLDCTFGKFPLNMPSKYSAIRQVINCIWKHPDALEVYLSCDLLGQEEILVNVSRTFGSKIFVDKDKNPECFHALTLTAPEILSEDPSLRFRVLEGFPRLYERAKAELAEAQANLWPEPLVIRPSTQWYVGDNEFFDAKRQRKERYCGAVRDQFGVWHICFSMHSSKEELEWALQFLAPKRVVSTTPSCMAMELDYVKKHCFDTQLSSDDPLWKLLDIRPEAFSTTDVSIKVVSQSTVELSAQLTAETQLQAVKTSTKLKEFLTVSPRSKRPPITLFGRARLGLSDFALPHEEKQVTIPTKDEFPYVVSGKVEHHFSFEDKVFELSHKKSLEKRIDLTEVQFGMSVEKEREFKMVCVKSLENKDVAEAHCSTTVENKRDISEVQHGGSVGKDKNVHLNAYSSIGTLESFGDSFRKLYRSMNVPVPQPLPSLVELMKANKRAKRFRF